MAIKNKKVKAKVTAAPLSLRSKVIPTAKPAVSGLSGFPQNTAQNAVLRAGITASATSASAYDTSAYDNATAAYEKKMKEDAEAAKQAKAAEYDAQAKAAYVSRLQNQRSLNDSLLAAGIRGGATETANAKMQMTESLTTGRHRMQQSFSIYRTGRRKSARLQRRRDRKRSRRRKR